MSRSGLLCEVEQRRVLFQSSLLHWAVENTRIYPWRKPRSAPYQILVAEVLLKRTTATAAAKVYESFLQNYPTPLHLAAASEEELVRALAPVGLYTQRARAVAKLARHLVEHEDGTVPCSLDKLLRVPGLGHYSARAVLSFGCGIPAAVVDANVARVLHRVFQGVLPPRPTHALLQTIAEALLPESAHEDFNFGLLDLGAVVCRYAGPRHAECPLRDICDFARSGQTAKPSVFGSRLRELRLAKRISLVQLAKRARVSKLTLINLEAGRTDPRAETVAKLAAALGVLPEDLGEKAS